MLMSTMTMVLVCTITLHHYMREEITIAVGFSSILECIITTALVPMEMSTMILVHMREEITIAAGFSSILECTTTTTLALHSTIAAGLYSSKGLVIITMALYSTIAAGLYSRKGIVNTTLVLYSRMDPTIATVWMKKLRQRGLIWPVLQSPIPNRHTVVSMVLL